MTLGPNEIRGQREGWWMCEESGRMRVDLHDDDPQDRAVLVTVELFEERLTVPVLPVHLVTRDDPALAAVVGSRAWTTHSSAAAV